MKNILTLILLLSLAGCSTARLGAEEAVETIDSLGAKDTEVVSIDEYEKIHKELTTKYKHVKEYEKEGKKYLTNETENPKGGISYQLIRNDGDEIISVCIGDDCDDKRYKKTIVIDSKISSSSEEYK